MERIRRGANTISVDRQRPPRLPDRPLPILELGTSAKMLSVVPLMAGGGLFGDGRRRPAPKHVQQLVKENYLRWDSLGEFFALVPSFEQYAAATGNTRAEVLADTSWTAPRRPSSTRTSPRLRRVGGIDNRGSHFYLSLYWAQELARQTEDADLAKAFAPLAETLAANEQKIVDELNAVQSSRPDIGGTTRSTRAKADAVMRPSATWNEALASLKLTPAA